MPEYSVYGEPVGCIRVHGVPALKLQGGLRLRR